MPVFPALGRQRQKDRDLEAVLNMGSPPLPQKGGKGIGSVTLQVGVVELCVVPAFL